ncbi:hypothetical protein AAG570_010158 [Ranatra chinensis]|uniref:Ketosynthase family 3 (KS3) domain-containing protein n=1 Tax=Ranatra chinensis TaxID=642074 RepID=A0ABD0YM54_9HEMI
MSKKYEVVISGVSGRFPECENVPQLSEMLNSRLNLVTTENCKWTPGALDVPVPTGKIKNISHFDMTFFGVHGKLRELMDHNICLCMTTSFEAICDAGMSPASVSGSNTAVFMNSMTSESEYAALMKGTTGGHGMLGHSRTMQANRISFSLNLKGPSCALDSTWCGGLQGLVLAQRMIERGYITAALVGGCNAHIFPQVSFHYDRMGMLTSTDKTKSFSDDADGYNRSEACVVLYLQRGEEAKRSYGTVVDVLARNFGSRTGGLADVAESHYKQLIEQIYTRSGVLTSDVGYVELDGCANKNIDAVELNCIGEVLCSNRRRPLLVGSVKSNLGHTEAASSLVSIVKALIALESGTIPPNLHYSLPNSAASHLVDGRIQVVTEPTPFCGNVAGVSNIGLCGTYGHVILKQNSKIKSRIPQLGKLPPDGLPRLVVMSGRDPDAMKQSFLKIKSMPIDEEFVALTHSVFQESIHKHVYRGYYYMFQNYSSGVKRPIWFVFSGMGSQWPGMGSSLMKIPMFARTIEKCQTALKPKGVDILDIITNPNPTTFNSILHSFVGIAAVQLGCAYADGCLTAEQMILSAYARGKASIESKLIRGKMAAVGLSYEQMKDKIPEGIEIACHNSDENCTLSGPEEMMEAYVEQLRAKGVFAKLVNVSNIAYHSKHISPAAPVLLRYLKQVSQSVMFVCQLCGCFLNVANNCPMH